MPHPSPLEEATRLRAALDAYTRRAVDDGTTLVCASSQRCAASVGRGALVEGQASFVGSHYGLVRDARSLRILVIPKQVGGKLSNGGDRGEEHVTVQRRGAQVDTAKYGADTWPRTNHMVGTEHALQTILGLPVGGEREVAVPGGTVHVFETMAMANMTLCTKALVDAGGQGSATMIDSCSRHLRRTMELLQPNVVLAQGWSAAGRSPSSVAAMVLGVPRPELNSLTRVAAPWGEVRLVAAYHPSRHWWLATSAKWSHLEPVLRAAGAP